MHTTSNTKKNKAIIEDISDEDDTDIHTASKTKKNEAIIEDSSDEHDPVMHTASKKRINKPIIKESSDEHDSNMCTPIKKRKIASRDGSVTINRRRPVKNAAVVKNNDDHVEITDDELNEYLNSKEDFGNLFDKEANDDEDTKDFPTLEDIAEETGEDLYDCDMYSVISVSKENGGGKT
nr:hypothetical protein [Tanacetum cinerariifolium]